MQFDAAVIVTTPQKLAFIDVAKGIRMFAKLAVPCVAVAENMAFFDADGKRHQPFGQARCCAVHVCCGFPCLHCTQNSAVCRFEWVERRALSWRHYHAKLTAGILTAAHKAVGTSTLF